MHKDLHPRDDIDYFWEEKEEEDLQRLRLVWIHEYKDIKKIKESLIKIANNIIGYISTDRKTKYRKQKREEKSQDKMVKIQTRRRRHSYEREISRKKKRFSYSSKKTTP